MPFSLRHLLNPKHSKDVSMFATDLNKNIYKIKVTDQTIEDSAIFSAVDTDNFLVDMDGTNKILIGLSSGILKIFDSNLSTPPQEINLGLELSGFGERGGAFMPNTPYLSVSTNVSANKISIIRLEDLCDSRCFNKCHTLRTPSNVGCFECPAGYILDQFNKEC